VRTHDPILPSARRPERVQLLGIGEGFPNQPPVHLARREIGALDIGCMRADDVWHSLGITVDDLDRDSYQATPRPGLDDLQILPLRLGALDAWWSAHSTIVRYLPPRVDQRLPIIAFPIGRHGRRRLGMSPILELGHQIVGDLLLGLADRAPNTEARITIQGYAAPEGAALILFLAPPFSPLWPT
jgi:hypothetical protein